jgi:hypothetical protein
MNITCVMVRRNRDNCSQKYTGLRAKIEFKGGIKEARGVGRENFKKMMKVWLRMNEAQKA